MRRVSYFGNSYIGLFAKTNGNVSFVPMDALPKFERKLGEMLRTEVVKTAVAASNLIGLYVAMNSNGAVLPNIAEPSEILAFKKAGLNVHVSKSKYNAHGNNISVNDRGGIVNPHVEKNEVKKMCDVLGVELIPYTVAGYVTVGSCVLATNKGFFAHFNSSNEEMRKLREIFGVDGEKGSINTGTGFVALGILANENGYVAGEGCTAFEMGRAEEALGFI